MNVPIAIAVYGIISLFALFVSLKRFIGPEYKKLAWVYYGSGTWAFIFVAFVTLNNQHHYLNNVLNLMISLVLFTGIGFIFYRFERKYKQQTDNIKSRKLFK